MTSVIAAAVYAGPRGAPRGRRPGSRRAGCRRSRRARTPRRRRRPRPRRPASGRRARRRARKAERRRHRRGARAARREAACRPRASRPPGPRSSSSSLDDVLVEELLEPPVATAPRRAGPGARSGRRPGFGPIPVGLALELLDRAEREVEHLDRVPAAQRLQAARARVVVAALDHRRRDRRGAATFWCAWWIVRLSPGNAGAQSRTVIRSAKTESSSGRGRKCRQQPAHDAVALAGRARARP